MTENELIFELKLTVNKTSIKNTKFLCSEKYAPEFHRLINMIKQKCWIVKKKLD